MNSLFEKQIFACKPYYYYFSGIITSGEWNLKIFNPAFSDCSFYTCTDGNSKAAARVTVTGNKIMHY